MKLSRTAVILAPALLTSQLALADASYQEIIQITGGSLMNTVKQVSFLSSSIKKMTEPTVVLVMVHGNRLARVSSESTEIIDLDQKTITHIDTQKKTYTVTTFAQTMQSVADTEKQLQSSKTTQPTLPQSSGDVKFSYSFDVKNTGETRQIEGGTAHEAIITSKMDATSATEPGELTMEVSNEVWLLDEPPAGYKEIEDFYRRMGMLFATTMADTIQSNPEILSKPGANASLTGMQEQMKKLKGFSVLEISRMGETANGMPLSTSPTTSAGQNANSGSSTTKQVATDTATNTASQETSKLGVFGSALGRATLGALGRKKQQNQQAQSTQNGASAQSNASQAQQVAVVLMETTTSKSHFSTEPVPDSAFEIPKGYKRLDTASD